METMAQALREWAWLMNLVAILLVVATRLYANTRQTWAIVGGILLIIGAGNALIFSVAIMSPVPNTLFLISVMFCAGFGCALIANWLTSRSD
jgi:hypothetical protein